jgi:soluble lytic murein transglycosylase-like protein
MAKKSLLAGIAVALSLAVPACNRIQEQGIPDMRIMGANRMEKEIIGFYKKQQILAEEKELSKRDKIYRIIDSAYNKLEENIPEYLTKKFVRTLIRVESGDNPRARSGAYARGLGQLTKGAWYDVEKEDYFKNVFIPEKNIEVTIKCLVWTDNFCRQSHPEWDNLPDDKKLDLISACYNGGPYGLKELDWDINKMPDETKAYIPRIHQASKEFIPSQEIYEN